MNQNTLYNVILTARYYIVQHADILLEYEKHGDVEYKNKREHVMRMILLVQPLERHYYIIIESGSSSLLSDEEVLYLTERLNELSVISIKN